jgi:hypothetical protein
LSLSNTLNPNETLGRYLTQKKHFSKARNEVTFKAFLPPSDLQLSVFRIDGLSLEEVWTIGNYVVNTMVEPRTLYGVGKIKVTSMQIESIVVTLDEPPQRHCTATNWPIEEAKQLLIAEKMAIDATPVFR